MYQDSDCHVFCSFYFLVETMVNEMKDYTADAASRQGLDPEYGSWHWLNVCKVMKRNLGQDEELEFQIVKMGYFTTAAADTWIQLVATHRPKLTCPPTCPAPDDVVIDLDSSTDSN